MNITKTRFQPPRRTQLDWRSAPPGEPQRRWPEWWPLACLVVFASHASFLVACGFSGGSDEDRPWLGENPGAASQTAQPHTHSALPGDTDSADAERQGSESTHVGPGTASRQESLSPGSLVETRDPEVSAGGGSGTSSSFAETLGAFVSGSSPGARDAQTGTNPLAVPDENLASGVPDNGPAGSDDRMAADLSSTPSAGFILVKTYCYSCHTLFSSEESVQLYAKSMLRSLYASFDPMPRFVDKFTETADGRALTRYLESLGATVPTETAQSGMYLPPSVVPPLTPESLMPAPTPVPAAPPAPVATATPALSPGASDAMSKPIVVEIESLTLDRFDIERYAGASGGTVASLRVSNKKDGKIVYTHNGQSGEYRIAIRYFDEGDGKAKFGLRDPDGGTFATVEMNLNNEDYVWYESRLSIYLEPGDQITIEGTRSGNEYVRLDLLVLTPTN